MLGTPPISTFLTKTKSIPSRQHKRVKLSDPGVGKPNEVGVHVPQGALGHSVVEPDPDHQTLTQNKTVQLKPISQAKTANRLNKRVSSQLKEPVDHLNTRASSPGMIKDEKDNIKCTFNIELQRTSVDIQPSLVSPENGKVLKTNRIELQKLKADEIEQQNKAIVIEQQKVNLNKIEQQNEATMMQKVNLNKIEQQNEATMIEQQKVNINKMETHKVVLEQPAFQRFSWLLAKDPQLPTCLVKLQRLFKSLENCLDFLHSRGEHGTFVKIQKSVQDQSGLMFTLEHLGQMMTLVPLLYRLAPIKTIYNGSRVTSIEIKLPVDYNIKSRQAAFRQALMQYVEPFHNAYLLKHDTLAPKHGWHPKFDLEQVPALASSLPSFKTQDHVDTLKKKAGLAKDLVEQSTRTKAQLLQSKNSCLGVDDTAQAIATENGLQKSDKETESKPKSRAQAILERIRAKQKQKQLLADQQPQLSLDKVHKRSMLKRLPMMATCLVLLATSRKRTAFPLPVCQQHITQSLDQFFLEPHAIFEHLVQLCKICPFFSEITLDGQVCWPTEQWHKYAFQLRQNTSKGVADAIHKALEQI